MIAASYSLVMEGFFFDLEISKGNAPPIYSYF